MNADTSHIDNLDLVRLFAASLVLVGHSYVFLGLREPLVLSTFGAGGLGVYIFFTISGYLVWASWERDPHALRFFQRRLLRIIPGLAVCVLLSILVLGPLFTTLPLADYWRNVGTRGYLRNIFLNISYGLPGVFDTNRVARTVNGSLWSLPVEFSMYVALALTGLACIRLPGRRWVLLAVALAWGLWTWLWAWRTPNVVVFYNFDVRQVFICGTYFWAGAVFQAFGCKRWLGAPAAVAAFVVLLSLEGSHLAVNVLSWVLLPVIVLSFGLAPSPALTRGLSRVDYSYGIYIYAFPVQQAVVSLWPAIGWWPYVAGVSAVTLALAAASWHLVESRALRYKPRAAAARPAGAACYTA